LFSLHIFLEINSSKSILPDELPDEYLYGRHIFTNKNEDYINIEKRNINKILK
jgi:hypothetical protein